ncbi:MAG: heparinase II/III family protein [Armatimonadota bacterium]
MPWQISLTLLGLALAASVALGQPHERAVTMSEEELVALIPDAPLAAYCECPNCYGGVEGNAIFSWSIDAPEQMTCRFCGTVFPNDQFPEDHELSGQNALGETVTFRYHLREETGVAHFLSANLNRWRRQWAEEQCLALARAYADGGDEAYARRAALILDRAATVYPHYPVMQNGPRRFAFRESQQPPWPWDSGRWGYFHNEIPRSLVLAFDLVEESAAMAALSQERGYDVRAHIENDFFRPAFEAIALQTHHLSNVIGYDVTSAAYLGRVLNDPRIVHWAFGWMRRCVNDGFMVDGMWPEGPAYHYMTIGGLRSAFDSVRGWSDPPGWAEEDGSRFYDLDPEAVLPAYARCLHAPEVIGHPNGFSACVHDTHPYARRAEPRQRTVSTILPGFGHASLGRGEGAAQMQAQLHFSGLWGHSHLDNLNLTLWAHEREMLPDVGYTWTQMRYWTTCTLGHNTVVIDRADQGGRPADGDLLAYFPDTAGVSAVEADGVRAYGNIGNVDRYRRLLVMVPVSEADAYVVDVFRVRGGSVHDWALHGDADEDTTAECSLPLVGNRRWLLEEGEAWKEPTIEGARFNPYGMVRDVATGGTETGFAVTFRYGTAPSRGLRAHILPDAPAEVLLGRSPSVRRMGVGTSGDMRKAYDFWMPHLLVRRRGEAPLSSTFAAVHEPFAQAPFIDAVEALPLEPPAEGAVALRIRHGNVIDTLISTLDEPPFATRRTADGLSLRGRLGIVRRVGGTVTGAWLFGGEELGCGELRLALAVDAFRGTITGAERVEDGAVTDALLADADLPLGDALRGQWLIVRLGGGFTRGCEIARVEERDGLRAIVLAADHGLRIEADQAREVFFPQRTLTGTVTFAIPQCAVALRGA